MFETAVVVHLFGGKISYLVGLIFDSREHEKRGHLATFWVSSGSPSVREAIGIWASKANSICILWLSFRKVNCNFYQQFSFMDFMS